MGPVLFALTLLNTPYVHAQYGEIIMDSTQVAEVLLRAINMTNPKGIVKSGIYLPEGVQLPKKQKNRQPPLSEEQLARRARDRELRSLVGVLNDLADTAPPIPSVTPGLAVSVIEFLQSSAWSHDSVYKRKECSDCFQYLDIHRPLLLVGYLQIESASPEVAAHLTTTGVQPVMGVGTRGCSSLVPVAMARFGPEGVPLVLEKMRSEVEYDDEGTDAYWLSAARYLNYVYGKEVYTRVRRLASLEEDPKVRERFKTDIFPVAKKHVETVIPRWERDLKMEWRRQRFRDAGEVPKF